MSMAAASAQVHPSTPPPPARCTVACTHLAWTAVMCLFLASLWLLFLGLTAKEIGRLARGEGRAVVTAAYNVVHVAEVTLVLVLPFGLLVALMKAHAQATPAAATDVVATKQPALKKSTAVIMRGALCDAVTLWFLASLAFALLMLVGVLVIGDSPVMGSRQERMGSVIYDVGALGMNVVGCFVLCPLVTVRVWRSRRKANTCYVLWYAVEKEP